MEVFRVFVLLSLLVCVFGRKIVKPLKNSGFNSADIAERPYSSCTTSTGLLGECKLPSLCKWNGSVKGEDIRANLVFCPGSHVCCPLYHQPSQVNKPLDGGDTSDLPRCGTSYPAIDGVKMRISGFQFFEKTHVSQYPWMAAIFINKDNQRQYICGGSLIHPRVVLTAAHCVNWLVRRYGLRVRVGDWDLLAQEEDPVHQEQEPSDIVVHPYYFRNRMSYDAALIIMKTSYDMNRNVGFACLPKAGAGEPHTAICRVTGWGYAKYTASNYETKLRMVEVPIVKKAMCEKDLREVLRPDFVLDSSSLCAGGIEGQDACAGDSGSPLVCLNENGYVQYGIVSWGLQCGQPGIPGVYTNVSTVKIWIDEEMKKRGFGSSTYTQP